MKAKSEGEHRSRELGNKKPVKAKESQGGVLN